MVIQPNVTVENQIFDVAIIGYGPTGATLANLLTGRGLQVLIIDREAEVYNLPRAVHFDDETMRAFQAVGIADDLSRCVRINPGMKFQDDTGHELLDWPRDQNITHHGWHASYRLHQPDLENLLRKQLNKKPNATQLLHCQVHEIQEHADLIKLNCVNRTTNLPITITARYVVGCDGANSLVQKTICDEMTDFGFCQRWLVVDLLLKRPRPDLGDHSIQFCDTHRPMTYCRNPGIRRRWEMSILDGESDEEISSDKRVWELLARWINPQDAQIERSAVYTFRSALARKWRKNRLLIAGDAAHQTPPFMGQGLCTGIRDALNLAWKLTSVLQNCSDSSLLDSYQSERSSHAQAYIETAIKLGGLINSMDHETALNLAREQADESKATIKSIQPKLGSSPYMHSISGQHHHQVGYPFTQVLMNSSKVRFDTLIGYNHALITRKKMPHSLPEGFFALSAQEHPSLDAELDTLKTEAVWVRPDRYIAAMTNTTDELLQKIPKTIA